MSERKTLLARAKELGLKLSGNLSNENLKKAIAGKEAQLDRATGIAGGDNDQPQPGAAQSDADAELVEALVADALKHNGQDYAPGDTVELSQKQFDHLEHLGVVTAVAAAAEPDAD